MATVVAPFLPQPSTELTTSLSHSAGIFGWQARSFWSDVLAKLLEAVSARAVFFLLYCVGFGSFVLATSAQAQSAATSVVPAATTAASPGTTWYIRPDGGSRFSANQSQGQCDGKADTAYPGIGTNQHCAFNDYRFLWDDRSYGNHGWAIAGGRTVINRRG